MGGSPRTNSGGGWEETFESPKTPGKKGGSVEIRGYGGGAEKHSPSCFGNVQGGVAKAEMFRNWS